MPSTSTSAGHGSLPGQVTQNFTLEKPEPLVVLLVLGCCSFPLTLVKAVAVPSDSLRDWLEPYLHCVGAAQFPLDNRHQLPQPRE